jgi:hypothetical protein
VVPEVKWISAGSSGAVARSRTVRGGVHRRAERDAALGRVVADDQDQLQRVDLVAPLRDLALVDRFRSSPARFAPPISIRVRIGSGPKAENSGVKIMPAFSVPSAAA